MARESAAGEVRSGDARGGLRLYRAFAVDLVAGHAGHGGLVGKIGARNEPGTGGILRLNEVADRSIEVHAVAAEAIVHQAAFGVVGWIGEDLCVGRAVRTGMPRGVLMLMAFLAVRSHRKYVNIAEMNCFRRVAAEMYADVTQLGGKARLMAIHARGAAVRGTVHRAHILRHFVAACASLAVL